MRFLLITQLMETMQYLSLTTILKSEILIDEDIERCMTLHILYHAIKNTVAT